MLVIAPTHRWAASGTALLVLGALALPGYLALRPALAAVSNSSIAPLLLVYGLLFALYLAGARLILRGGLGKTTFAAALSLALVYRVVLVPSAPTLSGDPYRYVWDARLLTHHISPYQYPPNTAPLRFLRDAAIYPYTGYHDVPTLYPPGAQGLFALTYLVAPDNVVAVKIMLLLCEGVAAAGLLVLLRARGQDPARLLLYLWNPLPILEIAGDGHIDAAAAAAIVWALVLLNARRPALAGAFIGLAALFKLFPLVLLGALDWRRDLRWAAPAAIGVVLLGYAPFVLAGARPGGYLGSYVADQDYNQLLYLPSHLASSPVLRHILHALPLAGLLVVLGVLVWLRQHGKIDTTQAALTSLGAVILFSPSLFPWYLLTLLPLLTLLVPADLWRRTMSRRTAGDFMHRWSTGRGLALYRGLLIFSGTIVLSYLLFEQTVPQWSVGIIEYAPVYLVILLTTAPGLLRLPRTMPSPPHT